MTNLYYSPIITKEGHLLLIKRVQSILDIANNFQNINLLETNIFDEDIVYAAHSIEFIEHMKSYTGLDGLPIWQAALVSAFCCTSSVMNLNAPDNLNFALTSEGGHHASKSSQWDMCYINHAAISALYYLSQNPLGKILIVDTDYHHGDGTENIINGHPNIDFICIHCKEDVNNEFNSSNCIDIKVEPDVKFEEYMQKLNTALSSKSNQIYDVVINDFGFDIHYLDYGGLKDFNEENIFLIHQSIRNFSHSNSKKGLSLQLAGGANKEIAVKVFNNIFRLY